MAAIAVVILSFASCFATVLAVDRLGLLSRFIDHPGERSLHSRPTQRGAGIGIVAGFITGLSGAVWLGIADVREAAALLTPALFIAIIGLLDDMRSVAQSARLVAQAIAASVAVSFLGWYSLLDVPFIGSVEVGAWGWPLAVVWIVAFTNMFNFMDGADGFAGSFAVVVGVGWYFVGVVSSNPSISLIGLAVAGAAAGFLPHNWQPARVFMGDVGSTFLGFMLATATLVSLGTPRMAIVGPLLLWPFVFDATVTLVRRAIRGERLLMAHRSHLYQRLVLARWSHQGVALLYSALAAVSTFAAVAWAGNWSHSGLIAFATPAVCGTVLISLASLSERALVPK